MHADISNNVRSLPQLTPFNC